MDGLILLNLSVKERKTLRALAKHKKQAQRFCLDGAKRSQRTQRKSFNWAAMI